MAGNGKQFPVAKTDGYEFIPNEGQWDKDVRYRLSTQGGEIIFRKEGFSYYFYKQEDFEKLFPHPFPLFQTDTITPVLNGWAVNVQFPGSSASGNLVGYKEREHYYNFFLGKEPDKWKSGIHPLGEIIYHDLYEGIDLKMYVDENNGNLKYDFILKAGADHRQIKIRFKGATKLAIEYGDAYISTPYGTIREKRPIVYQVLKGRKERVNASYVLNNDNTLSFLIESDIDSSVPLIIDPELIFSTYSGSSVDNFGYTATFDHKGNLYAGGIAGKPFSAQPSGKYPVTDSAFQIIYKGDSNHSDNVPGNPALLRCDMAISKYSSDGSKLLFATYLGSVTGSEFPHSLVVDKNENLIVMGSTNGYDYPVSSNAFQKTSANSFDIVVTKFTEDGRNLVGSTYMGGPDSDGLTTNTELRYFYADDFRGDVNVDAACNIYVASCTQSDVFPHSINAPKKTLNNEGSNGVVFKLTPDLSALIWGTYIGGVSPGKETALYSIDFDQNGHIYVAGGTTSNTIATGSSTFQATRSGGVDGVIVKLKDDGSAILACTYYGTDSFDQIYNLELDESGNVYIVGQTEGKMPVSPGKYANPNSGQFIAKLNDSLNRRIWSTTIGSGSNNGKPDITINAFLVDECDKIYLSGWGGPLFVPNGGPTGKDTSYNKFFSSTRNLPVTGDAYKSTTTGKDFYLMTLAPDAEKLLFATYFGGDKTPNHVDGGTSRFDKKGVVYQSVCASCNLDNPTLFVPYNDFPTTSKSVFPNNSSLSCSNAAFKYDMSLGEAKFGFSIDTCTGMTSFSNETVNYLKSYWSFGDDETSTLDTPSHIYKKPGTYQVMLVANPGTQCADTAFRDVIISEDLRKIVIPNVFTPNGDGINDEFEISGINAVCDQFEIWIYNRWGNLFFHSKDPTSRWNGQNESKENAPEGVYFFIVDIKQYKGEKRYESGTISIIRDGH